MVLIVQCEDCGRVKLDRAWTWADFVVPDIVGFCLTCGEARRFEEARRWAREGRKLLRDRARGYGPQPGDPFRGFREEEK